MAGWLDGIVGGIAKGVDSAKEGSKLFVEKAKINSQIQDVENEKNQLIMNMGRLVYNLQSNGEISIEQCNGLCSEILALDKKIIILQQNLQSLETTKSQSEQYMQMPTPPNPVISRVYCECGFANKEGAKFCAKCGKSINE